ncbi:type II toxin-antitoxin system PemK/MazF family toxin [Nocardia brasiliensis]|uniref:type II toxin-antitoxin system PemK/MazF family toxin n=1 Tax=Nocardia brasiliensis TaxID=37326 RepID=UPI002454FD81|nr:type II toxin-antitoxin system PemK/MazF family toxin [Nocardia brasiliensis]
MRQGDVYLSDPSPLTGERELYVVISSDEYNDAAGPTVVVVELETGTRYRATPFGTAVETPFGVALADRLLWLPRSHVGERFDRLDAALTHRLVDASCRVLRGAR